MSIESDPFFKDFREARDQMERESRRAVWRILGPYAVLVLGLFVLSAYALSRSPGVEHRSAVEQISVDLGRAFGEAQRGFQQGRSETK